MKNFSWTEEIILQDLNDLSGRGKELTFNNHPVTPLYTVWGDVNARGFGLKARIVGKYSKLEEAMKSYETCNKFWEDKIKNI